MRPFLDRLKARLRPLLTDHRDGDVMLNQPGRALMRCVIWGLALLPLGLITCGQTALLALYITAVLPFRNPSEVVLAELAGSGSYLGGMLLLLVLTLLMVYLPLHLIFFGRSRVPPPLTP